MKKALITGFFMIAVLCVFAAPKKSKQTVIRVGIPKAPPALPIIRMIDSNALGDNVKIEFTIWDSPEHDRLPGRLPVQSGRTVVIHKTSPDRKWPACLW